MSLAGRDVAVLGAGIGGLAVARALALRGARVTVLEQAEALREVGAGIQIGPNAAAVLRALGLGEAFDRAGLAAEAIALCDGADGEMLARLELDGPPGAYRFLHRADLIALLAEGAREAGVEIRFLHRIAGVTLADDGPVVRTETGAEIRPGLLIGADGLHSVLRGALNGPAQPFFTGQIAWRAVIPAEPGAAPVAEVHMAPGRHLVSYPLRGGLLRNIVAVEARDRWVEESWSLRDDAMEMRLAFAGFSPRVRDWLEQVEDCWLWGLFRHALAKRWWWAGGTGGAAILGDAAHPTLPFLAQGAAMALEDAWVLADCLDRQAETLAALAAYQSARAARCARVVEAANRNARAYHLSGPARDIAHLGLRAVNRVAPSALLRRFDWLYHHDVTAR